MYKNKKIAVMKNYNEKLSMIKINTKSHIQFFYSVSFTPVFVFIKIDSYVVIIL